MSHKITWRSNPTESKSMKPSKRIETQQPKTSYSILSLSLSTLSHSPLTLSSSFSLKTISKTPLHPPTTTRPPIPPLPMTHPSGTSSALSSTHLTSPRTSSTLAPSAQSSNLTPPPPPRPHPIESPPWSLIRFTSRESRIWYQQQFWVTHGWWRRRWQRSRRHRMRDMRTQGRC